MNRARALFQNLQPIIIPKDNDRFGQLEIATLRLHASIIPIEREWRTGAPHMRFPGENKWYPESQVHRPPKPTTTREHIRDGIRRIILNLMCRFETEDSDRFFTFLERQLYNIVPTSSCIQTRWDTTDMLWAEKTSYCPRQLYMLPIALDCGKELSENKSPRNQIIWGLILHRLPGKGQYGRVGMFMTGLYEIFRNPELLEAILGRMPKQALANFLIEDSTPSGSLWRRICQAFLSLFRPRVEREDPEILQAWMNPDGHLDISDSGLHLIEIL